MGLARAQLAGTLSPSLLPASLSCQLLPGELLPDFSAPDSPTPKSHTLAAVNPLLLLQTVWQPLRDTEVSNPVPSAPREGL